MALLIVFAVIFTYPMLWLLSASLKPATQVFSASLIPDPIMWSKLSGSVGPGAQLPDVVHQLVATMMLPGAVTMIPAYRPV